MTRSGREWGGSVGAAALLPQDTLSADGDAATKKEAHRWGVLPSMNVVFSDRPLGRNP
jgi:hypothetical protein